MSTQPTDPTEPTDPTGQHAAVAPSVGQTGGLPGANASPRASELSEDEKADTVSMTGTSVGPDGYEKATDAGSNG